jgi:hypothetical protein
VKNTTKANFYQQNVNLSTSTKYKFLSTAGLSIKKLCSTSLPLLAKLAAGLSIKKLCSTSLPLLAKLAAGLLC